jgi:hypothetical protein
MAGRVSTNACKNVRLWRILGFAILAVASIGCHHEGQAALRVANARSAMENQLAAVERNNDGSTACRIGVNCLKEGLRRLSDLPGNRLPSPIPILATVTRKDRRLALQIDWVEDRFYVNGFYLVGKSGSVHDFPGTIFWNQSQIEFLGRTAWRERWIPVITTSSDRSWDGQWVSGVDPSPVVLPTIDYSKGEIRLGLLTTTGREPLTVVVAFLNGTSRVRFQNDATPNRGSQ